MCFSSPGAIDVETVGLGGESGKESVIGYDFIKQQDTFSRQQILLPWMMRFVGVKHTNEAFGYSWVEEKHNEIFPIF